MAESQKPAVGNTAVPNEGDHDRVVMLSLRADGSPAQHNPEIIGDKQYAVEAAKRQFAEQAVSARDVELRGVSSGTGTLVGKEDGSVEEIAATTGEDPSIKKLADAHESAAKAAESAAEKAVNALVKD